MELKYTILLACIVLTVYLIYKELKRKNRALLTWRILASIFMSLAFAAMLFPISYTVSQNEAISELHLVTQGEVDLPAKTNLYTLDSSLIKPRTKYIPDLAYYLASHPEVKKLHVYGFGLPKNELDQLRDYELAFSPAKMPSGIIASSWPALIKSAMPLNVQGIYHNGTDAAVKLLLFGMGVRQDSVLIKAGEKISFSLKAKPKQAGQAIYQLIALQKNDTLSKEPLPFRVAPQQEMRILVLAASPDFEYKFLKKWLFENQYQVALRTRISKNKFSTDFLNMQTINVDQIQPDLLKNIDLLVLDEEELNDIGANERAAILQSVVKGMGAIVRLTNPKGSNSLGNFVRYEVHPASEKQSPLQLDAQQNLAALPFAPTLFLKENVRHQTVLQDDKARILASSQLNGMGLVIGTTLGATYQWQLSNENATYANFWSTLFAKVAKKEQSTYSLQFSPQFFAVGQKTRVILDGLDNKVPQVDVEGLKLNWRQNMELPFEWDAIFWPELAGWNEMTIGGKVTHFYAYHPTDWQSLKNAELLASQRAQTKPFDSVNAVGQSNKEISKWWFFIIFLVSAAFLWFEQRVLNAH